MVSFFANYLIISVFNFFVYKVHFELMKRRLYLLRPKKAFKNILY
jgi:hypothetical protein